MSNEQKQKDTQQSISIQNQRHITLIEGRFIYNSTPLLQAEVVLKITTTHIIIQGQIPNERLPQKVLPLISCLTYRIINQSTSQSQNRAWILQLNFQNGNVKFTSTPEIQSQLWDSHLNKRINKLGSCDNYIPSRIISRGNDSKIFLAFRRFDNKQFAIKTFAKSRINNNTLLAQALQNQIRVLRQIRELQLPNLIHLEEVYSSNTAFYLIFQFCPRELNKGAASSGVELWTREKIKQILLGLASLHQRGIVHRDLKPQNIMYSNSKYPQMVIIDLGLATYLQSRHPYIKCGTRGYVAPQIFSMVSLQTLTPACDVFSLGAIFHQLLTKQMLFHGESMQQVFRKNRNMDFSLNGPKYQLLENQAFDLLKKMLQIDPSKRITARDALAHPYFKEFNTIKKQLPTFPTSFSLQLSQSQSQEEDIEERPKGRKIVKEEEN